MQLEFDFPTSECRRAPFPRTLGVFYHGSRVANLRNFSLKHVGSGCVGYRGTPCFFFSASKQNAKWYAYDSEPEYLVTAELRGYFPEVDSDHPSSAAEQYYDTGVDGIILRDVCDGDLSICADVVIVYNPACISVL